MGEYREKRIDDEADRRDPHGDRSRQDRSKLDTAEGRYTLGLLLVYTGDINQGREYLNSALDVFLATVGIDHDKTQTCQRHLDTLEKRGALLQAQEQLTM